MKLKVDEKADAEMSPGVILDFNGGNQVVGVEILNLSKPSPKLNLRELQFQFD